MTEKNSETLALPIREISRLTGVNTVTLRAWERRYGLLKPVRTGKGHRLYSEEDVQRVKDIQSWLARGLAISKVKTVLTSNHVAENTAIDNVWLDYSFRIGNVLAQLDRRALEKLLGELISLYPAELIADQLLGTLLEQLQMQSEYGTATKHAFLHSVLFEQFYFGQYRQRQTAHGKRILVVKLCQDESDILPLMLNYSLLVNTFQAEYLGYIPHPELVFAVEQYQADGVLLYSDSSINLSVLHEQLLTWQKTLHVPIFLSGKITRIYKASQQEANLADIFSSDSQHEAILALSEHFSKGA